MGLSNNQLYKPTKHYIERVKERFNINDALASMDFFKRHCDHLQYKESRTGNGGTKIEVWTDGIIDFVLDVTNKHIITCYESKKKQYIGRAIEKEIIEVKAEQSSVIPVSSFGISQIKSIIFNELFVNTEQFLEKIVEMSYKITLLQQKMKNTKRRDYQEKQLEEGTALISELFEVMQTGRHRIKEIEKYKEKVLGEDIQWNKNVK